MFKLSSNEFIDKGICKYIDAYGNTAFMKRTSDGFTAKIRFANSNIKASPLNILVPPVAENGEDGTYLHLDYLDGIDHNTDDVNAGISEFTELIQHWIQMLYDIKFMDFNNNILKRANTNASLEDIYMHKISLLQQYEELVPFLSSVFNTP